MSESLDAGAARPSKETNSVETCSGVEQASEDDKETRLLERVAEFTEVFPQLAEMPLSETHGRKLRRIVTESSYETVTLEAHEDRPQDSTLLSEELRQRTAVTWDDAVASFLDAHLKYDGLLARFGNDEGEQFDIELSDSWGVEYNNKNYARAKALQREMSGGERPSGVAPPAQWEDPMTAMLTLTGSSVPDGARLSPVDHLDSVHDSFSYDGTRDALRNTMEYHLGLEPDEWGYWLQTEPHGVGDGEDAGLNACYTHIHVAVYFDGSGLDGHGVGCELERVIDKHLGVCEPASFFGHDYEKIDDYTESEGCISVNGAVEDLGTYLASYLGISTEQDLLEQPIEYIAWGALYWATGRRRMSRSQLVNDAIAADRCDQRFESEDAEQSVAHGEQVAENSHHGADVVCARCNSGWRVDQSRLDEIPRDDDLRGLVEDADVESDDGTTEGFESLRARWPSSDGACSVGETLSHRDARREIRRYLAGCSESPTLPQLKGALQLSERWGELARVMLDGSDGYPDSDGFMAFDVDDGWQLEAIVDKDGELHAPGGGGIDTVSLHLPHESLTDALHGLVDGSGSARLRCDCGTAAYADSMAYHLIGSHGVKRPGIASGLVRPDGISG